MKLYKILFPDRCPNCDRGRRLTASGFCSECREKLISVSDDASFDADSKKYYDGGRCSFAYSSVVDGIYRFKYMNRIAYAESFAKAMCTELSQYLSGISPDALIPVPIHKKRLIKRGYNQATELALEISKLTGIPVKDKIIIRQKNTVPQKIVRGRERANNLKKAFIVVENDVNLRRVVIVDDIVTTGSTINLMAKTLKEAGVNEVYFVALARAGV